MKKLGLLLLIAVFGLQGYAQNAPVQRVTFVDMLSPGEYKITDQLMVRGTSSKSTKGTSASGSLAAAGDTIWSDDFSSSTNWTAQTGTVGGQNRGWFIGSGGTWYFGATTINSTSGAPHAVMDPADPTQNPGPAGSAASFNMTNASPINCSGKAAVFLEFEQWNARFTDSSFVEVSDNGTNWTRVYDNMWLPVTSVQNGTNPTSNPHKVVVNISSVAANKSTVYVRFRWKSLDQGIANDGVGYGWFVDDVAVLEGQNNVISLNDAYFWQYNDSIRPHMRYWPKGMPARQANGTSFWMSGLYENQGQKAQPNAGIKTEVTGPASFSYTGTTAPSTLPTASVDSGTMTTALKLNNGTGKYDIVMSTFSDSTLYTLGNDTVRFDVSVTDSTYYRNDRGDVDNTTAGTFYTIGGQVPFEIEYATVYDLMVDDTITAVEVFISQDNMNGPTLGTMQANVYAGGWTDGSISLANAPLFQSAAVKIDQTKTGQWIRLPVSKVAGSTNEGDSGTYIVSILFDQAFSADTMYITMKRGGAYDDPYDLYSFARGNSTGTMGNWGLIGGDVPYINLITKAFNCPNLNGSASATPTSSCGNIDGTATAVDPTNGTAPYTYLWDLPGNPTTKSVGSLASGVYNVTIKDKNGCNQVASATVSDAGAPTITNDQVNNVTCAGNGEGSISFNLIPGSAGSGYTFNWTDGSGSPITGGDSTLSNLESGNYTVEIVDGAVPPCKQTRTFTVTGPTDALALPSPVVDDVTCYNDSNGTINLVPATGGTGTKTYTWSNGGTGLTQANLKAGPYTVTVTDASNCTATRTINVTQPAEFKIRDVGSIPNISTEIEYDASNTLVTITVRTQGGNGTTATNTYRWTNSDGVPLSPNSGSANVLEIGPNKPAGQNDNDFYTVVATDPQLCTTDKTFEINATFLWWLSVEEFGQDFTLSLFPNPNDGSFRLVLKNADNNDYTISVRNALGQTIYSDVVNIAGDYDERIDLDAENGVYFLSVSNGVTETTHRVVVR
ncbi:T9SS type A sorting domain-containing protein [bacterium SCSIO 12741]|nr:T9SS type A sorting domain-containing protein [bacterium SCSIO 12741]